MSRTLDTLDTIAVKTNLCRKYLVGALCNFKTDLSPSFCSQIMYVQFCFSRFLPENILIFNIIYLPSISWTLTWWTTSSSFASHPASSCPCDTSLACCWAAACLWGWVYSDKLLEELTERLLMICWTICTMSTLDKTHANIMMKSKVFQWENILVLEDFSLPQLTFLKLVRLWIMTKDHSIGFLISLKLLINHH